MSEAEKQILKNQILIMDALTGLVRSRPHIFEGLAERIEETKKLLTSNKN